MQRSRLDCCLSTMTPLPHGYVALGCAVFLKKPLSARRKASRLGMH